MVYRNAYETTAHDIMAILLTGGTGFVGRHLAAKLSALGHDLIILSRTPQNVDQRYRAVQSLDTIAADEHIDGIINLAGAPIDKRWTDAYKKVLINSRIRTTQNIIDLIERLNTKPSFLMSASAVGYYGAHPSDAIVTEETPPTPGFTHELCQAWENTVRKAEPLGVRVCYLRFGVVLGHGGMLKKLLLPYKWLMGGRIGDGKQGLSWIHIDDLCAAILFLISHKEACGPYNLTAPEPTAQGDFARALGAVLKRPTFAHIPGCVVNLLFGEMGRALLLEGARVYPQKLQKAGFTFTYPTLASALQQIINA
jgi:uncharacterized protein (TIGR01777 family)